MTLLPDIADDCLTNASVFLNWAGTGDICNGRGTCVNGHCECFSGWTGRGDVFTLQGYACVLPLVVDQIMWGLVGVSVLYAYFIGIKLLYHEKTIWHHPNTNRDQSMWKIKFICGNFVGLASVLGLVVFRAILNQNAGVQIGPTVCIIVSTCLFCILGSMDRFRMLTRLVESNIENKRRKMAVLRRTRIQTIICTTLTLVGVCASFGAAIQQPIGPTVERLVLVYVQVLSELIWFADDIVSCSRVEAELKAILPNFEDNGARVSSYKSVKNIEANRDAKIVLEKIQAALYSSKRVMGFFIATDFVFLCVPQMLVFQYMPLALLYFLQSFVMFAHYVRDSKSFRHVESSKALTTEQRTGSKENLLVPSKEGNFGVPSKESKEDSKETNSKEEGEE